MNPGPATPPDLLLCLSRLACLQHQSVDRLALDAAVDSAISGHPGHPQRQLAAVGAQLQLPAARWLAAPDPADLPALIYAEDGQQRGQWGVLESRNAQGQWVSVWPDGGAGAWREQPTVLLAGHLVAAFRLGVPGATRANPVRRLIFQEFASHARLFREAFVGGVLINVIALASSLYSMQVYDRVVPTGASQTLLVLTLGALGAVLFELAAKQVRSHLYERLTDRLDQRLARATYLRFLSIRMDQLPNSVGALAAQMRGYETVRGFFTSITTGLLVDAPFALLFAFVIALIGGPLAAVPAVFFVLSVALGLYHQRRVNTLAGSAMQANNLKTGLLVEAVEGAEVIKSGQGGWRMYARWTSTADAARINEVALRKITEHAQHLAAAFQQCSYILLVASGALLVSKGELSMGGLIACSILSGRVLAPIATISHQIVQWAHTKAALQGLERLFDLQDDHHGQELPVTVTRIAGRYRLESVVSNYGSNRALAVAGLAIGPGEKVGVLGPVGAGKTSLLRLLSGMYKPQEGRVLLDDIDLAHISKPVLAENMAYVLQDGRLFSGTLRDNLILGQRDPGDEAILDAARMSGLLHSVILPHPKGLQQEIHEGGSGLSGGQRQLVNLTRAFLRKPRIWLLDEPTASMDRSLEMQVLEALRRAIGPQDTLILVTHKPEMLALVERLLVVANHQIVLDGPKADVLRRLHAGPVPQENAA
jgi:ATP-binding cassette subfamily C protein LapB